MKWSRTHLSAATAVYTAHAGRQCMHATLHVVMWPWPYTAGGHCPTWAQPYPIARGCSREVLFHSVLLTLALALCFRYRLCSCSFPHRSACHRQPPLSHLRAIQPSQRELHDAMHLLHRVLAGSPPTKAEQPRFLRRRLPPWGAHRRPPLSEHLQPHDHFKKGCLSP
jgi:hypothetical protein